MLIGGVYMLESILNNSNSNSNYNRNNKKDTNVINDLLSNLLSGQNAKITIKIEAGKSRNQRGEDGQMMSESLNNGYNSTTQNALDELTGGLFGSESDLLDNMGTAGMTNRSPLANDVLGNLLSGGGPEKMVPLELLLAVLSKMNPYAGSVAPPVPPASGGDLLGALLGRGGMPPATQPAPPAGLPFMEGMPGLPPTGSGLPPEPGGAGLPSAPNAPMPPMQGGGIEELIKKLMSGRV